MGFHTLANHLAIHRKKEYFEGGGADMVAHAKTLLLLLLPLFLNPFLCRTIEVQI